MTAIVLITETVCFSENDNEQTSRLAFGTREIEDETDERCSLGDATEEQSATESILCSVCGDVVAGFHCGAYVCEACKVRLRGYKGL